MNGRRLIVALPLIAFIALGALFYARLYAGDPSTLPSALIGRQAPDFSLPPIPELTDAQGAPVPGFSRADLVAGHVTVINVWASWCAPCRQEHPLLVRLSNLERVRLVGIAYKDAPENSRSFLAELGNPFAAIGMDENGRAAIDWGVYGVPETFVVDGAGRITYRHVGPLTPASLTETLIPEIEKALGGTASAAATGG